LTKATTIQDYQSHHYLNLLAAASRLACEGVLVVPEPVPLPPALLLLVIALLPNAPVLPLLCKAPALLLLLLLNLLLSPGRPNALVGAGRVPALAAAEACANRAPACLPPAAAAVGDATLL